MNADQYFEWIEDKDKYEVKCYGYSKGGIVAEFLYRDEEGEIIGIKNRIWKEDGEKVTWWDKSFTSPLSNPLYKLENIKNYDKKEVLCLSEGENDTISLLEINKQAIGVSGIYGFKEEYVKHLKGFKRILICFDNDDAGRRGGDRLSKILFDYDFEVEFLDWEILNNEKEKKEINNKFINYFPPHRNRKEKFKDINDISDLYLFLGADAKYYIEKMTKEKKKEVKKEKINKSKGRVVSIYNIVPTKEYFIDEKVDMNGLKGKILDNDKEIFKKFKINNISEHLILFVINKIKDFNFDANKDSVFIQYLPNIVVCLCDILNKGISLQFNKGGDFYYYNKSYNTLYSQEDPNFSKDMFIDYIAGFGKKTKDIKIVNDTIIGLLKRYFTKKAKIYPYYVARKYDDEVRFYCSVEDNKILKICLYNNKNIDIRYIENGDDGFFFFNERIGTFSPFISKEKADILIGNQDFYNKSLSLNEDAKTDAFLLLNQLFFSNFNYSNQWKGREEYVKILINSIIYGTIFDCYQPYNPITIIFGDYASGKTTLFEIINMLLCPQEIPTPDTLPSKDTDFLTSLVNRPITMIDNLNQLTSSQREYLPNILGKLDRPYQWKARKLYSQTTIYQDINTRLFINAIDPPMYWGDVISRSLFISLEKLEGKNIHNKFPSMMKENRDDIIFSMIEWFILNNHKVQFIIEEGEKEFERIRNIGCFCKVIGDSFGINDTYEVIYDIIKENQNAVARDNVDLVDFIYDLLKNPETNHKLREGIIAKELMDMYNEDKTGKSKYSLQKFSKRFTKAIRHLDKTVEIKIDETPKNKRKPIIYFIYYKNQENNNNLLYNTDNNDINTKEEEIEF